MSPIPPFNTPSPILRSAQSFNIDQINQINAFFSSTAGIVTFSAVWLFCVVALFLVTGWLLTRHEEENRTNPELAQSSQPSVVTNILEDIIAFSSNLTFFKFVYKNRMKLFPLNIAKIIIIKMLKVIIIAVYCRFISM
eukprot:NP_510180.1 Uncharacterized protein CELE_F17H10.4 [Caenorhabditis elegans]